MVDLFHPCAPGRCFLVGLGTDDPLAVILGGEACDAALGDMRAAGLAGVSFSTVSDLRVITVAADGGLHVDRAFDEGEAYSDHRRQLAAIGSCAVRAGMGIARTASDIRHAHDAGGTALILTCEGADFVEGHLERLDEAHQAGVRCITLVHYRVNELGDIQTAPAVHGGLTADGAHVVGEMNRLGMLIDLAHASYATTMDVLRLSEAPVVISHTHLNGEGRSHPRLVSHRHARAVAQAGGLVGAWPSGVWCATFADFVEEIVRLVDAVGVEHVAIGTDMEANYKPVVSNYAEYAEIEVGLRDRGFAQAETDRILGGNALELIQAVCG